MSAVCLKNRKKSKNKAWNKIFSDLGTENKSCLFMKQLTTTCVSNILYSRKILPESFFESNNYEGVTIKSLKSDKSLGCVRKIQNWLNGAFEAIEKKYLKHFMLDIKDPDSKKTLEIYTMTFCYQEGNEAMNISLARNNPNKENVRQFTISNTETKTIQLFQMCYAVTESSNDLPARVVLAVRLSYHENTPQSYQPKGYIALEPQDPVFLKETRSIEIGVTGTNHHLFRLVNKSCLNENFFKNSENKNVARFSEGSKLKGNKKQKTQEEPSKAKRELFFEEFNKSFHTRNVPQLTLSQEKTTASQPLSPVMGIGQTSTKQDSGTLKYLPWSQESSTSLYENSTIEDVNYERVRCACLSEKKGEEMLKCLHCKSLVHAECFGLLKLDCSKRIRFYCHICHQEEGKYKCPDKVMIHLKHSPDKQKLALLRRMLKVCCKSNITTITLKKMESIAGPTCSKSVVEIVFKKMIEIGVAVPQKRRKSFIVDKFQLTQESPHYFYQQLDPTNTKVSSINSQEIPKRNIAPGDFSTNKKFKSTAAPQVSSQFDTQQSLDIFYP